jgi:ribosomal 50S subunit-recycling heat shock protein
MLNSIFLISSLITHHLSLPFMRLDLFLKASRLVLRRTLAQEMCEAGVVRINGAPAKSSRTVSAGDEIALRRGKRLLTVRVLAVPASRQTARSEASSLYQIISDTEVADPLS